MTSASILTLPEGQLPEIGLAGAVSVTIWFCLSVGSALLFSNFLRGNRAWPEFKAIEVGSATLGAWYFFTLIDRWLHYSQRPVKFGYVLVTPIWECFRIASTIIFLWGTYQVVWKELEDRFNRKQQNMWWMAARFAIFVVGLVSVYYFTLNVALAIIWLDFRSLNSIADVATKRAQFEVSMAVFFFVFSLLTVAAATATILYRGRQLDGAVRKTRVLLWLATIFLFARSATQMGCILNAYNTSRLRIDLQPADDISFGLLTFLYVGTSYLVASNVSATFDRGSRDVRLVESDIRKYILERLEDLTNGGRAKSPPFRELLDEVEVVRFVVANGPLSSTATMSPETKQLAAIQFIDRLKRDFGKLDPMQFHDPESRNPSRLTQFLGRRSAGGRSTVSRRMPSGNLSSGTSRRATPSNIAPGSPRRMPSEYLSAG
ncbi:hypothetical protein F4778DRAFT_521682 [Xylariomycetidae sp. FL2044]|nr:hypothetical protein F4778DRAFT_521682 [Xylariomycetidae sp. FL2044]